MESSCSFFEEARAFSIQHNSVSSTPTEYPQSSNDSSDGRSGKFAFMQACLSLLPESEEIAWNCLRICFRKNDADVEAFVMSSVTSTVTPVEILLRAATAVPATSASVMALRCLMNLLHSSSAANSAFSSLHGISFITSYLSSPCNQLTSQAILYATRLVYMLSSLRCLTEIIYCYMCRDGVAALVANDISFITALAELLMQLLHQYETTYNNTLTSAMSEIMKLLYALSNNSSNSTAEYLPIIAQFLLVLLLNQDATLLECQEYALQLLTVSGFSITVLSSHPTLACNLVRLLDVQLWRSAGVSSQNRIILLTPILGVLTDCCSRCNTFKQQVSTLLTLPNYTEIVSPSEQLTLLRRLMKLLLSIEPYIKRYANEFMYTLCNRDDEEFVRVVGIGYAAGYLQAKAAMI